MMEEKKNKKNKKVNQKNHFNTIFIEKLTEEQLKNKEELIERTIHVSNINPQIQPQQLIDFFSVCGPIGFIRIVSIFFASFVDNILEIR